MLRSQESSTTFSTAGERSLQGYSQYLPIQMRSPIPQLHEKSLYTQTQKIPLQFAQQRNKLEYLKGLNSYKRKGIDEGPYMLNFLNRKRNMDKMRKQVLQEIEDKIGEDKYYIYDQRIREEEMYLRRVPRNRSLVTTPQRRNIFQIEQQDSQYEETVTSRSNTRRGDNISSNSQRSQLIPETSSRRLSDSYTLTRNQKSQKYDSKRLPQYKSKDLKEIKEEKPKQKKTQKKKEPEKKSNKSSDESEDQW